MDSPPSRSMADEVDALLHELNDKLRVRRDRYPNGNYAYQLNDAPVEERNRIMADIHARLERLRRENFREERLRQASEQLTKTIRGEVDRLIEAETGQLGKDYQRFEQILAICEQFFHQALRPGYEGADSNIHNFADYLKELHDLLADQQRIEAAIANREAVISKLLRQLQSAK